MGDISWMSALVGGSGGGSSDYEKLANTPITNITGVDVVIAGLETGVYNIEGSWKMTAADQSRVSFKDDLFYVLHDGDDVSLAWVSAAGVKHFTTKKNDPDAPVVEEENITTENLTENLVGHF